MKSAMASSGLTPTRKGEQIQQILEQRIAYGDYNGRALPPERELAVEIGVSRMTARKAVQQLIDRGLLLRQANGRVEPAPGKPGQLRIAFLVPSLVSQDVERWRLAIDHAARSAGAMTRAMIYLHWDDPTIGDALDGFDSVFLYASAEPMPPRVIQRLRNARRAVAVLGRDLTAEGIPSINLFPPVFVQRLLDHLAELGHRSVDCFNVQTIDPNIEHRIEQWNLWRAVHRLGGTLVGEPIQAYDIPLLRAYEQAGQLLDSGQLTATAIMCTTAPAAVAMLRAMRDRGIRCGIDKSVCTINDEGLARFMSPSLTCIEMPDPLPYVSVCIEWMQHSGESWIGRLLLEPTQVPLFYGESTGPVDGKTN